MNIFLILLIIFIVSIIPSMYLFKQDGIPNNKSTPLKLSIYLIINIIYIILFIVSSIIYLYNFKELNSCGNNCVNYTNSYLNIILGLILYTSISNIYYIYSKNLILKFHYHNNNFKYIILIIYTIINYCITIFAYYIFGGILGKFVIKNIFINILRWIIIFEPILIYPLNIIIITLKQKKL